MWKFLSSSFSNSAGLNFSFLTAAFPDRVVNYSRNLAVISSSSSPAGSGSGLALAPSFSSSGVITLIFFGTYLLTSS